MSIVLGKLRWVSKTDRLNSTHPLPILCDNWFGYFHVDASWYLHGKSIGYRNSPNISLVWNS